jgi:hypothetical protein
MIAAYPNIEYAGGAAYSYNGNGKTWFLGSPNEIIPLANYVANNSIILNASGNVLNTLNTELGANTVAIAGALYIDPIRQSAVESNNILTYDTTSKEITFANIMLAAFTMANMQHWTSNVSTIGDALNQLAQRIYNIENP